MKDLIDKVAENHTLTDEEFLILFRGLEDKDGEISEYLFNKADKVRKEVYGTSIYMRGLIEFTNYCKNDCYYCGIRRSNCKAVRYRLTKEDIIECCQQGYELGFRTFVLQGGEDPYYTDEKICDIVSTIKERYTDCAVTLSVGEKSKESYSAFYEAGADRYLLRHETADYEHYRMLHPSELSAQNRQRCLVDLKEIGFQVGCGIMVGSPGQTYNYIIRDIRFMQELKPHMIGIGPFIPHSDTPFHDREAGSLNMTLHLLSILRLIFPDVLLPATTALGTIHPLGREMGIKAGANVVMPNLSPVEVRDKYHLYDGKICTGDEAAECCRCMQDRMKNIGFEVVVDRGDHISKRCKLN